MTGEVSYIEIGAPDAGRAREFFGALFGWPFQPMGNGGEGAFETPSLKAGVHGNDPAAGIQVFFSVPDIAAAVARVRELGGSADAPGAEEEGFGQFCSCKDPQGVSFGLHVR